MDTSFSNEIAGANRGELMVSQNRKTASKFWWKLIETLSSEDPWYDGFRPKKTGKLEQSAIQHNTGEKDRKKGVWLCFRWRNKSWKGPDRVEVTVTIEKLGFERANNYLEQLKNNREEFESKLTREFEWEKGEYGSETARIITHVPREGWDDCILKLRDTMNEYRKIIEPYFKDLGDLKDMYYYVIKFHNTSDGNPWGKAGISVNPRGRFKNHLRDFSNEAISSNWKLEHFDDICFPTGEEAWEFEQKMLKVGKIRSPNIKGLSSELFSSNPLDYARENGWI